MISAVRTMFPYPGFMMCSSLEWLCRDVCEGRLSAPCALERSDTITETPLSFWLPLGALSRVFLLAVASDTYAVLPSRIPPNSTTDVLLSLLGAGKLACGPRPLLLARAVRCTLQTRRGSRVRYTVVSVKTVFQS